ncbi:MAG: glycosyltransferase family 4 protein [Bacteriovoracaceae bacterium]
MRIGYDAKRAFHNLRGLGNYSRELIRGVSRCENDWDIFLFSPGLREKSTSSWINDLSNIHSVFGPKSNPMSSIWRSYTSASLANKKNLDVYHGLSHELPIGLKSKQVLTVHDLLWYKIPKNFSFIDRFTYKKKLSYSLDRADKVLAISESTKNDLIEIMRVNEDKIEVHYQSCHEEFLTPHTPEALNSFKKQLQAPDQFILSIGAIEPNKNTLYTLKVFQRIKNQFPDLKLVIVGDGGPYKRELFDYVDKNKLSSDIVYFPYLDTPSLKALYQLCDLFLFPSHYEGFGLPVIEALFLKAPVVAAKQSNIMEAGGHGCFYIDQNNIDEGVAASQKVLNNAKYAEKRIEIGYKHVQQFHWLETSRKLTQIYKNIMQ